MSDNHIAGEYTFASDNIGDVHHARVKIMHGADGSATDVSTASPLPIGGAAADDAAAAGNPVPIGGVYQETVDEVDDGDVGRVRMTARRALVTAIDGRSVFGGTGVGYGNFGDLTVVRDSMITGGSYVTLAAAYFEGDNVAFDATPVRVRIPMLSWEAASIGVYNNLGVSVTLSVEEIVSADGDNGGSHSTLYSATLANGAFIHLAPYAGGTGAAYHAAVPGLANPALYYQVSIVPASDPSSGGWRLHVVRR